MNQKKYNWILYLISITILITLVVQVYWNYKNYLLNKQNFTNAVQISLDNALENYYADLAESNQLTFVNVKSDTFNLKNTHSQKSADSIFINLQNEYKTKFNKNVKGYTQILDSANGFTFLDSSKKTTRVKVVRGKQASDSIKLLKNITSIYVSIQNDTLDFSKLNSLITKEFQRKNFNIPFALKYFKNDSLFNTYNQKIVTSRYLTTTPKTRFLKGNKKLELAYPNAIKIILKQSSLGILLSLLLSIAIISSLFYLLKIIKHQKQLAEVKNDLISNITHEFKTPISTIGVALESIKDFNVIDDKEKTKNYLEISSHQLTKLHIMVEKLLETATLNSENLNLMKEEVNISNLLQIIVDKHRMQIRNKTINYNSPKKEILAKVDTFHFENSINNVIDNAIKYGEGEISVELTQHKKIFEILISDNGTTLTNAHKDKIFEQFYRVPKGNTHDIKGFGIGLYYTKKIIEKHKGSIHLDLKNKLTIFKISLPIG